MRKLLIFLFLATAPLCAKVYDCFMFFNELDVLKIRFEELYDVVDYFVLVESHDTHQGKAKPLYFTENKEAFEAYSDKIIHVIVEPHPELDMWGRENFQRRCIERGLKDADPFDLVIVSDCDEIPRAEVIKKLKTDSWHAKKTVSLQMNFYAYYLNRGYTSKWRASAVTTAAFAKKINPNNLRYYSWRKWNENIEVLQNAGWHFHSMGGLERFTKKIDAYAHPLESGDTFESRYMRGLNSTIPAPIDETFPKYVQENQEYLKSIGYIWDPE